jgi:transient receptor potential cation channel subfamily A member 1
LQICLSDSAQGALAIVQMMFKMQPQEKRISLFCTDIQKMTPLHCASMFDHSELVEFLVVEGADINALGEFLWELKDSMGTL